MRTLYVIIYVLRAFYQVEGVWITNLRVPAGASHEAPLDCRYDLEGDLLYDVKWYKDGQQFFRCLPTGNVNKYDVEGVTVIHYGYATVRSCPLILVGLNPKSAGEYRCEVSTEGPAFKVASQSAKLRIIPLSRGVQNRTTGHDVSVNTTWNAYSSKGCPSLTPSAFINVLKFAYLLILFFGIVNTFL